MFNVLPCPGLGWAVHCLACNKTYQDKCRKEIFEKVGDKDFVTRYIFMLYSKLKQLKHSCEN